MDSFNGLPESERLYKPKNILITGGAGFIASHVAIHFCKAYPEYNIFVLDKMDVVSSRKNLADVEDLPNFKFIEGNILNLEFLNFIFSEEKIDTILHFAAESHVDNSFGNSIHFTRNNVLGTHTIVEAAHKCGMKRFVHVSTDEVYGETEVSCEETAHLDPTNPYAATKAAAEYIVKAYAKSFKFPMLITRGNNVYGPHQYPEKIIPKFIKRLSSNMKCCIHGNGSNTRRYIYVTDVARAFDFICHRGQLNEVYNIGTNDEKSNIQVANELIKVFKLEDRRDVLIEYVQDRAFNDARYDISFSKLESLGWRQGVQWDEGIKRTVEWYASHPSHWVTENMALSAHPDHSILKREKGM